MMHVSDGRKCHRRKEIVCGKSDWFVERVGEMTSMKSHYRVGEVYPLLLTREERECLKCMGRGVEFLVRVVSVEVKRTDEVEAEALFGRKGEFALVITVDPVSEVVEGTLDQLVASYWLAREL